MTANILVVASTRWNERAVVSTATRMLMTDRRSPERVARFLANIQVEDEPSLR